MYSVHPKAFENKIWINGADKTLNPKYNRVFLKFIFKTNGGNKTFMSKGTV